MVSDSVFNAFLSGLNIQPCPRTKLGKMLSVLAGDYITCLEALDKSNNDFNRRNLVRVLFAFIEGGTFSIKGLLPRAAIFAKIELAPEDKLLIDEKLAVLDGKGNSRTESMRLAFLPNLRFVFKISNKLLQLQPPINLFDSGWHSLQIAKKLRDRITHPKTIAELEISEDELCNCKLAFNWFFNQVAYIARTYTDIEDSSDKMISLQAATT